MNKFIVCLLVILFYSCEEMRSDTPETTTESPVVMEEQHVHVNDLLPFKAPTLPDTVYFADEIIPLTDIDIAERFDRELVVNNYWHSNTLFYFKRAYRWFPLMEPILKAHNIPQDFLYLAVIESGLTQAQSPSNAVGFWQFLAGTAEDYGLIVNRYIDERKNIEKSTVAACQYLNKAYEKFGSWSLAAAAYNRGKGGINSDLNTQGVENFYDLHLNEETSRYVFRILAVKYIMENPEKFGFFVDPKELYLPIKTIKIEIVEPIPDLIAWSEQQGINYKILKKLNPWILQKELPFLPLTPLFIEIPAPGEHLSKFEVIRR
jgi:membrane-bound lytic murein transglycosylase D